MRPAITAAAIYFVFLASVLVADEPTKANREQVIGLWHLSGQSILEHDMRETRVTKITEAQRKALMPLADILGTRYSLVMFSNGTWELRSVLSGDKDPKERTIFTALLGAPCSSDFYYDHRFPNDPKQPCSGKWSVAPAGGMRHTGFPSPYPVVSPGKIVVNNQQLTFFDAPGERTLVFRFVGKYRFDPDPKHRPARAEKPVASNKG